MSQKGFFKKIPLEFRDLLSSFTGDELKVWLYHYLRSDKEDRKSYPKLETIAKATGVCLSCVKVARKKLRSRGLLITEDRMPNTNVAIEKVMLPEPCAELPAAAIAATPSRPGGHPPAVGTALPPSRPGGSEVDTVLVPRKNRSGIDTSTTDKAEADGSAAALAVGEANEHQIESCSPEDYSFALELCKAFHKCSGNKGSLENNISLWIKDAVEIVSPFETIDEVIKPLRHALLRSDDYFWQQGKLITMRQVKKALPTLINQFATLQRIMEQHPNWSFDYEVGGLWKGLYELKARDYFAIGAQIWKVKGKGILERLYIDADTAACLPGTDDDGNPRDAQEAYIDVTSVPNVGEDI